MVYRQGSQHDAAHQAEYRGICADAEGQRGNGYCCEARILRQHWQPVANVLPESLQLGLRKKNPTSVHGKVKCNPELVCRLAASRVAAALIQTDAIEIVPGRHVGQNHLVADLQAIQDFDRIDGTAAQLHVDARGF